MANIYKEAKKKKKKTDTKSGGTGKNENETGQFLSARNIAPYSPFCSLSKSLGRNSNETKTRTTLKHKDVTKVEDEASGL